MGAPFELVSTPGVYLHKAARERRAPHRACTRIAFGDDPNQAFICYEPPQVLHRSVVMYYHGGGYLVGTPQSMGLVADTFNAQGYRFVSLGFALMPRHPFPAQVDDAFCGVNAAISHLEGKGVPCDSVVMGGSSAGGHAAALVTYGRKLQQRYGVDGARIKGLISLAGVMDIDDMLARGLFAGGGTARFVDLPGANRRSRESMHRALAPYSPIQLIDAQSTVPMLVLHGRYDRMSPYATQVRFTDKLNSLAGAGTAQLHTLESRRYQHIRLTAGLFTEDFDASEGQRAIFDWMDRQALA